MKRIKKWWLSFYYLRDWQSLSIAGMVISLILFLLFIFLEKKGGAFSGSEQTWSTEEFLSGLIAFAFFAFVLPTLIRLIGLAFACSARHYDEVIVRLKGNEVVEFGRALYRKRGTSLKRAPRFLRGSKDVRLATVNCNGANKSAQIYFCLYLNARVDEGLDAYTKLYDLNKNLGDFTKYFKREIQNVCDNNPEEIFKVLLSRGDKTKKERLTKALTPTTPLDDLFSVGFGLRRVEMCQTMVSQTGTEIDKETIIRFYQKAT